VEFENKKQLWAALVERPITHFTSARSECFVGDIGITNPIMLKESIPDISKTSEAAPTGVLQSSMMISLENRFLFTHF